MATRKRKRRRRRRGSFLFSLLTFLIIVGAIFAAITVFLRVGNIEVSGNTKYTDAEIIETSGIQNGDNLIFMNKFNVAEKILEEYPYIEQITIRRRLPDTFTFSIVERKPSAFFELNGKRWLTDNNAYILEMLSEDTQIKLPEITGAEVMTPHEGSLLSVKNSDQVPALSELLTALQSTGMLENTVRIEIGELYDIHLVYGDRFLVSIGDADSITKKIEMLKAVIAELSDADRGTINVSAVKEARFRPDINIDLSENRDNQSSESDSEVDISADTAGESAETSTTN